jgi:hypothetical protein
MSRHLRLANHWTIAAFVFAGIAALLEFFVVLASVVVGDLLADAKNSTGVVTVNASLVITAQARALNDVLRWVNYSVAPFLVASALSVIRSSHHLRQVQRAPNDGLSERDTFVQQIDLMLSSLAEVEANFVRTRNQLEVAETERERNESLIALTKAQAQAVKDEFEQVACRQRGLTFWLTIFGVAATVLFGVLSLVLANR